MSRVAPHARTATFIVAVAFLGVAWSAVPVEESTGTTVRGAPRAGMPPTSTSTTTPTSSAVRTYPAAASGSQTAAPGGTAELFYQLQLLQSEISELRGLLEEQQHQISRLEANQKEQYLDVDRRLSALAGTTSTPRPTLDAVPSAEGRPISGSTGPAPAASGDEQTQFNAAYKLVTGGQFDAAITALTGFLRDYPDGKFAPNAYYWLGEAYLGLPTPDLERARHAFSQLPQRYPTNAKVADALFKLGAVYHSLGDTAKAMDFFNRVQREFPGSAAAQLAQSYAAEL